jgi:acyl carrier protein
MTSTRASEPTNGSQATDVNDFDAFVTQLGHELDVSLDGAWPEARLVDDLGLDSIALFRLLVLLEDVAPHDLPLELVDSLETLADVWHWHANLAGQRASAGIAGTGDAGLGDGPRD